MCRYYWLMLAAALVLGTFLRFLNLGKASLTDSDARQALQVLSVVRGEPVQIGGQPGYVGLTSLMFFIFGSGNFAARFWPALFGAALVLVPALYRKQLPDTAGVTLAFLIAMEPGLVALSRSADGSMIAICALLAGLGFLLNRKCIPAGVMLGVALTCGEDFWLLGLTIGISWLLLILIENEKGAFARIGDFFKEKTLGWGLTISAAATALIISSQFFIHPSGISGIGSGLVDYFKSWISHDGLTIPVFSLVFLTTQLPAIVLGIWGLIVGLRRQNRRVRLLGLWWGIGLVLGFLNPSHYSLTLPLVNLPLFVLAAMQIANLLDGMVFESRAVVVIEMGVTISLFLFSALNFLNMVNFYPSDAVMMRNRLLGIFLPMALWIAFTILLSWGWNVVSTRSGLLSGVGVLLLLLLAGSGWKAAGLGSHPENELLTNQGTITGESQLLQTMTDVARWNSGQANRIDVTLVGLDSPALTWALRDFETVTADSAFPVSTTPSMVISNMENRMNAQTLYRGQQILWSLEPDYSQMTWQGWAKWNFVRTVPQQKGNLILWVRNDLFKDGTT